jgi:hypothetical protein
MHQAGLVHSDVTLSNILINTKTWRACLCDLGLSSITDYSRVHQTARGYAPENPVPCQGHDMFGLTVCMIDLFAEIKIYKKKTAAELRNLARTEPKIPKSLRPILCKMCPDDPKEAILSKDVLWKVFEEKTEFDLPEVELYKVSVEEHLQVYLQEQMMALWKVYNINRCKRCYRCLIQFLSGPEGSKVEEAFYDLYMVAALYVFACLYGKSAFTKDEALETLHGAYSEDTFLIAVQTFINNGNFVTSSIVSMK